MPTFVQILDFIGTFAFAISGIRLVKSNIFAVNAGTAVEDHYTLHPAYIAHIDNWMRQNDFQKADTSIIHI